MGFSSSTGGGGGSVTFATVNAALATANASIDVNAQKVIDLLDGSADSDAAAFGQVKQSVRVNPVARVTTAISRTVLSTDASVDVTANSTTQTLEATPATSRKVRIFCPASNTSTTIDGNGKNVNGAATFAVTGAYAVIDLEYNGTEWRIT